MISLNRELNADFFFNSHTNISFLNCEVSTEESEKILERILYWIGGVGGCALSCIGLVLNVISIIVLFKNLSNQNIFNHLLITLFFRTVLT